jgi:hypothetical protein
MKAAQLTMKYVVPGTVFEGSVTMAPSSMAGVNGERWKVLVD